MPKIEVWSIHYSTYAYDDSSYDGISKHETFTATCDKSAKEKVLWLAQKFVKRLRRKNLFVHILAAPYINYDPNKDKNACDGDRMLRLRHGYDNRRILRVKNPDVALVQGYGPKQWDEVTGQHIAIKTQ